MKCYDVIFTGRVQGVGFRYTAQEYAQDLSLTGWIKNLHDGSVRMLVEGEEEKIKELIKELETSFLVKEKLIQIEPATNRFFEFEITY